ncbi:MAG TPA: hypothetical protein VGH52_09785 [Gaiellaceae bacterium]|jgi:uncharacterized membrane protein YeaQ/YmgE (transglycosylase-associated protein family)
MSLGLVLTILWIGLVVGGLARFAIPGPDPMPLWLTIAIGLVGSIAGAGVGRGISGGGYLTSFVAFGVSIGLVAAYRKYVQRRPIVGEGARAFPERGFGVEHYRERLKRLGIDPDNLSPDPKRIEKARLLAALDELHRAGLIDDDELAAKRAQVEARA